MQATLPALGPLGLRCARVGDLRDFANASIQGAAQSAGQNHIAVSRSFRSGFFRIDLFTASRWVAQPCEQFEGSLFDVGFGEPRTRGNAFRTIGPAILGIATPRSRVPTGTS